MKKDRLECIVRAHEVKQDGYEFHKWRGKRENPPVITIFSAPNYCGSYGNDGAVLSSSDSGMNVRTFGPAKKTGEDNLFWLW